MVVCDPPADPFASIARKGPNGPPKRQTIASIARKGPNGRPKRQTRAARSREVKVVGRPKVVPKACQ
jgi:hypothetical protein